MITPEQAALTALKETTEYLERLSEKNEEDLVILMDKSPAEHARLLVAMAALITKMSGNLNKNYETVAALELSSKYDKEIYEVRHVKHSLGSDIVVTNKETREEQHIEVKHSMTTKAKHYKANWNFTVDGKLLYACKREQGQEQIALLIESIYRKQRNGVSYLSARTGTTSLQNYEVSGAFISLYCVKKLITSTCLVVNIGCDRCDLCNHYHRILHLRQWGQVLDRRIRESGEPFKPTLEYFTLQEWISIMRQIPSKNRCFIFASDLPHNVVLDTKK